MMENIQRLRLFLERRTLWVILPVTVLVFIHTIGYEPLNNFDDGSYVFSNPNITRGWNWEITQPVMDLWTPLPMLTYLIDYAVGGFSVYSYHIQNILWHLAATVMVYWLLCELKTERLPRALVTLIFAVHPQRIESVVWISERKDVVAAAFFFAALAVFVHYRNRGRRYVPWSWLLTAAALFSKPTAVALPAVMFLLEVYRTRKWDFRVLLQLWPLYCIIGGYFLLYDTLLPGVESAWKYSLDRPLSAILLGMRNYLLYAGKTFLPLELNPMYPHFIETPLTSVLLFLSWAAILAGAVYLWFRKRDLLLYELLPFVLIFMGILLPVSGFFPFSSADYADRYSYLPSVFLLIPAAVLLCRSGFCSKNSAVLLIGAYLIYLICMTLFYQQCWRNNETLLRSMCDVKAPNYRAAAILAFLRLEQGNREEALQLMERASYGTLQARKDKAVTENFTYFIRGIAAYQAGDKEQALKLLSNVIQNNYAKGMNHLRNDGEMHLYLTLAAIALEYGEAEKAAFWYDRVVEAYPREEFLVNFYAGVAAMLRKNYAEAIAKFETASELNPDDRRCLYNLTRARQMMEQK